jgi:hypothetical protein
LSLESPPRCELTRRDALEALPARVNGTALKFVRVLAPEAKESAWRLVEFFSVDLRPFEVRLSWTGAHSASQYAQLTITRGTRICVWARSLVIDLANLSGSVNKVAIAIGDTQAFTPSRNRYELRGTLSTSVARSLSIPPWATSLRVDTSNPTAMPNFTIRLIDGNSNLMAALLGNAQPGEGVPLGGAEKVELTSTVVAEYRAAFNLTV